MVSAADLVEIARLSALPLTACAPQGPDRFVTVRAEQVSGRHVRA
ncbi:hypothetical protein [Streptosporangium sp. NBC_01756]|nr:hypothetical protein [Streptosporangium sp. NBC_01756]WSC86142.1 hypothetical protein OIE48_38265 [Streptosporangium sp. NBC_01756]